MQSNILFSLLYDAYYASLLELNWAYVYWKQQFEDSVYIFSIYLSIYIYISIYVESRSSFLGEFSDTKKKIITWKNFGWTDGLPKKEVAEDWIIPFSFIIEQFCIIL